MRKIGIALLCLFLFLPHVAFAALSDGDKKEIETKVETIVSALNRRDITLIIQLVPEDNAELRTEITESLEGMTVQFDQDINGIEEIDDGKVKVSGVFAAQGIGWETSGLSNYYTFENRNGEWLLVDTDFHTKLGPEYVFTLISKIFMFIIPIMFVFEAFWVWMLIDAIRRKFDEKTTWIILILLGGGLGAILYFFIERRKLLKQEKAGIQGMPPPPAPPVPAPQQQPNS